MSVFSGPQQAGAMREHRETKRAQAQLRNTKTPQSRRRAVRRAAQQLGGGA